MRFVPVPTDVRQPATVAPAGVFRWRCLTPMTAAQRSNMVRNSSRQMIRSRANALSSFGNSVLGTGNDIFVAPFHALV